MAPTYCVVSTILDPNISISAYEVRTRESGYITNEEAGYGKYFGHSTGHGVGVEIHEHPFAGPKSEETIRENAVVTVEPGIYLPGKFGVRIEDMVLVTADGHKNFCHLTKDLVVL